MANAQSGVGAAGDYHARVGTFVITADPNADMKALHPKIADAIRSDSRVLSIATPQLNEHWMTRELIYPASQSNPDELLRGSDVLFGIRYPQPYALEISVPAKNQPRIHGEIAAADHYFAAWDGWTAVVLWSKGPSSYVPASAGQVLTEILRDAAATLGLGLYVQACSPACDLQFAHRSMAIHAVVGSQAAATFEVSGSNAIGVEVVLDGVIPMSCILHREVSSPAADFSQVKNVARRILNIEAAARKMTSELIALDYVALSVRQESRWTRVRTALHNAVHHRGENGPKRAQYLIACLWLAMASIELLQHRFADMRRNYGDSVSEWAVPELFDGDLKSDESSVEMVDAQFARAAVEYKSTRIDTRLVVIATTIAGLAGGLLGLFGALITLNAAAS